MKKVLRVNRRWWVLLVPNLQVDLPVSTQLLMEGTDERIDFLHYPVRSVHHAIL